MKKRITQDEYLKLLGLLTLASDWNRRLSDVRDSATLLLEVGDDEHGHLSDAIYSDTDITTLLSRLEVDVDDAPPKEGRRCRCDDALGESCDLCHPLGGGVSEAEPRVFVFVSGGNVQTVLSTQRVDVAMIDYDNMEADDKYADITDRDEREAKFERDQAGLTLAEIEKIAKAAY